MQRCGIGESRGLTHGVRTAVNNTTTNTGNMLAEWISGALNTHPPPHYVRRHVHLLDYNSHFTVYMHVKSSCCTPSIYTIFIENEKKMKLPLWFQVEG